ncbi:hypothetical protein CBS101457_004744 [Exobasidium rhododendri]|nr:hypothetical protein CBS101457_004744 [Exobasidium rhododendri]
MSPYSVLFSFAFVYAAIFVGASEALMNVPRRGPVAGGPRLSLVVAAPLAARTVPPRVIVTFTSESSTKTATAAAAKSTKASTSSSSSGSSKASSGSSTVSSNATAISPLGSATDVFLEGGKCKASWTPAASGTTAWENMNIDLMSGSNLAMTKLATVASDVDGTSADVTSYNFTCPSVTPNAAIYFLQFTTSDGSDPTWTTRFTIANAQGNSTAPTEANQPEGGSPAIPWGEGQLQTTVSSSTSSSSATASKQTSSATSTLIGSSGSKNVVSSSSQNGSLSKHRWTILSLALPALASVTAALL